MKQGAVAGQRAGWKSAEFPFFKTKIGVTTLVLLGAVLLLVSFYFPYWNMDLRAPQYPEGLKLSVYLDHVEGDVSEINILNHYIGMGAIDKAAEFERRYAWFGLVALAVGAMLVLPVGRKVYKVFYLPPFLFLGGFIGDFFYWMHRFGHELNPDAPVRIKPFTPTLLGSGTIGQFKTFALFGSGFWLAVLAFAIMFYAIAKKKAICNGCPDAAGCSAVCNRSLSWVSKAKE